jgi:F-type H+-transporting ATPase subunit gamma
VTRLPSFLQQQQQGGNSGIIIHGDRVKAGLERVFKDEMIETISESGKQKMISFAQACELADVTLQNQSEFKETIAVYNHFKSVIAYETTLKTVPTLKDDEEIEYFDKFEFEGNKAEVMQQYHQFRTASRFYYWSMEAVTSEQSARMTAMDNSSKNAAEMLDNLNILYNRNRQSRITTELTELISGAAAAEEQAA